MWLLKWNAYACASAVQVVGRRAWHNPLWVLALHVSISDSPLWGKLSILWWLSWPYDDVMWLHCIDNPLWTVAPLQWLNFGMSKIFFSSEDFYSKMFVHKCEILDWKPPFWENVGANRKFSGFVIFSVVNLECQSEIFMQLPALCPMSSNG